MKINKIFHFKKHFAALAICLFAFTSFSAHAYLPPISNAQMYSLATMGNVQALRAAIQRGLNIDTLDRNGNTALCHSILQRNYTAYNTLRAAGANPNHPCVQNVSNNNYDSFMASNRVVPITANSREAYAYMGQEDYIFSTRTWLIGGALLLGGLAALLLGGGGGGGSGGGYYFYPTTNYSLGAIAGTKRPDQPESNPYNPIILLEQNGGTITNGTFPDYNLGGSNPDGWVLSNDSKVTAPNADGENELQSLTDLIDFRSSALKYSDYIQAAMKGIYGSTVNNGYAPTDPMYNVDNHYQITLKNNTAGLVALKDSYANNYDLIKIIAKNGTLGMIASQNSTATNQLNGKINMTFQGDKDNHSVTGMYADTAATINNEGTIYGLAQSASGTAGMMVGMRGQLINQEYSPFSTTQINNRGNITLEASADNRDIKTGMVGMGSFVEQDFMDGAMFFSRAGYIALENLGTIALNVVISGANGSYNAVDESGVSYLLKGIGGIVGMRADGNSTATNNGLINVTITDTGDEDKTVTNNHAGMQSVHNGKLVNGNTIKITGGIGGYGMLAVRGEGNNPEIDSGSPTLINNGNINVDSKDGFGMASYHGGTSTNTGTITLAKQGTGIQHNIGSVGNIGSIILNGGGTGIKITQNGNAVNESTGSIYVDNALSNTDSGSSEGTDAEMQESAGIFIENGTVTNKGTITIANTQGATNTVSYGIKANKGEINSSNTISISDAQTGYGISIENGNINNSGAVKISNNTGALNNIGYGLKANQGNINNSGAITIDNINEQYGISIENGSVKNTGTITLNNVQQAQNKTSYGIKAEKGNVYNDADIYMNVTGDMTAGVANDSGSFGIWGNEASITNAQGRNIVFSKRGNGMHTASGQNDNYGNIHMQMGGTGMSTESGNATNRATGTITIDDTGVGMKSGIGKATNDGQINITGTMSTGMESANDAENNGTINITGYNSIGMSVVAENARIVNNSDIIINTAHNGLLNYGMYGSTGVYSRMINNGNITITGRQYPTTENIGYGMHLDEGEAQNYGVITLNDMFGYGMNLGTGGTLDNYNQIILNYGGIGMGASGSGASEKETAATVNHAGASIKINGQYSYGMKMLDKATAWNDGSIEVTGEDSFGIYSTDGSGTNTSTIVMNSNKSVGMHSENADTINKSTGVITIKGEESVGMETKDGGTSDTSLQGAVNEGTINLEASSTGSTGMKVTGSGKARNKGTINVKSSNSSGMLADGAGTVDNSGDIFVTGSGSFGMKATAGTATNNKNITIDSDDSYGMYADGGAIVNGPNGTINITAGNNSIYAMYVLSGSAENNGTISLTKDGVIAMYARSGTAVNNKIINLSGANAIGMQGEGDAQLTNNKDITIGGNNSIGMEAGGNSTTTNEVDGVITVNGPNSKGMVALGVTLGTETTKGTAINSGTIIVNDPSSEAMYADGGIIKNTSTGKIITNGSIGMNVNSGQGVNSGIIENTNGNFIAMQVNSGSIENEGRITLSGANSVGMKIIGSGTASNSLPTSLIEITGANSIGMQALSGTASNYGTINANNATAVAMQADGGTIINENGATLQSIGSVAMLVNSGNGINRGEITLNTNNIVAMQVNQGTISNENKITLTGDGATGMKTVGNGAADNIGNISVSGSNGKGMWASGAGTATNSGTLDINNAGAYALYADNGGTIVNSSGATINTTGKYALYVANSGNAQNKGDISNNNVGFHAIHLEGSGTGTNTGTIALDGSGSAAMFANSGTLNNTGGTIIMNGDSNTYGIQGGSGTVNVNNTGTITVTSSGSSGTGIGISSGNVANRGEIVVSSTSGTGISTSSGNATNYNKITVTGGSSYGMMTAGGTLTNDSGATLEVHGNGSLGMYTSAGGKITNNGALTVEGDNTVGMLGVGNAQAINGGTLTITGNKVIGMEARNNSLVTNTGTIYIKGSELIGMKATNSSRIDNQGTIIYSGTTAGNSGTDNIFHVDGTSSILNQGTITNSTTTTTSLTRNVFLGSNGNFTAAKIAGELSIDGSALDKGTETTYVLKNALTSGDVSDVNLIGTAWFNDVEVVESEDEVDTDKLNDMINGGSESETNGSEDNPQAKTLEVEDEDKSSDDDKLNPDDLKNHDVIARKGKLNTILATTAGIEDRQVLDQIDAAYEAGRDSQIYSALKYAPTQAHLANAITKELGLDFFANFTKQNFDVIKSVDRQINSTVFNNTDTKDQRIMVGYDFMGRKQNATAYQADYEDQAHSTFAMLDKKFNNNFRYGLGVMFTKYNSDYDDDASSRKEFMVQVLAPLSAEFGNTKIVSVPRLGAGFGEYKRHAVNERYEADTTNYYYGVTNEARHNINMGWFGLEPTVELNVLGMYQSKMKENGALVVESSNNISVETGIGLYATKTVEFANKGKLNLRAGGTYYHELANPFKAQKARMTDADIRYRVNGYEADRDRAVISFRMDYGYEQFNVYGEFSKFIEKDDGYAINAGLGYKF